MAKYNIKLISKELIAESTMLFRFEKPEGFAYQAGQYADFTLIDPPETDDEGSKRTFSFASAPCESEIMIATRLRDTAFKRILRELPVGSELELDGPYGSFALPKDPSIPAVFLTGGIGVTFVRSMVTQALYDQLTHKMVFFYSNLFPASTAFLDEFSSIAEQHPNFIFIPTMTQLNDHEWDGEQGLITRELLEKHITDLTTPIYYLSGSGAMVGAMRKMLADSGVGKYAIRTDQFIGY